MPNYVMNVISCEQSYPLTELMSGKGRVDFNLIIPQPANLEYGPYDGEQDEAIVGRLNWNRINWGTKWNASSTRLELDDPTPTLSFKTAWSHPWPIISTLSQLFKDSTFEVKYADEDLGYNLGHYNIKDGLLIGTTLFYEEGSYEARNFASNLYFGCDYENL